MLLGGQWHQLSEGPRILPHPGRCHFMSAFLTAFQTLGRDTEIALPSGVTTC